MNLDSIILKIDREIYIDELILWLQNIKHKADKVKPIVDDKLIELKLIKENL